MHHYASSKSLTKRIIFETFSVLATAHFFISFCLEIQIADGFRINMLHGDIKTDEIPQGQVSVLVDNIISAAYWGDLESCFGQGQIA